MHTFMSTAQPNPDLVKALRSVVVKVEPSTKTLLLDEDVNRGLDALKLQVGGSKQDLANKLLRAALFTDALSDALAMEATP
jgi:hypothetical protein